LPLGHVQIGHRTKVAALIDGAHEEMIRRRDEAEAAERPSRTMKPPEFLCLFGMQGARDLRKDGYKLSSAAEKLVELLREGPDLGLHTIVWIDTMTNLQDILEPKLLSEFGGKVALTSGDPTRILGAQHQPLPKLKFGYSFLVDEEDNDTLHKIHNYGEQSTDWLSEQLELATSTLP